MIENPLEYKNKLLSEFREGKITMDQLQKECAYWYMETFDTFHPRPAPSTPTKYLEFKAMPLEKQFKISQEFYQSEEIKSYMDMKDKIKNENKSHVFKLKEFFEFIPKEDTASTEKYLDKMEQFRVNDYA